MRFGIWEILLIALLVVILFGGAKKLPEFAKSIAEAINVFKSEDKKSAKKTVKKKSK
jgi:TatA/E family protein of Tat protein translocase